MHSRIERQPDVARVSSDVATGRLTFSGKAAGDDVRNSIEIAVPELPWPLRFDFCRAQEEDGTERLACVGFSIGGPVAAGTDTDDSELTVFRERILLENLPRYRQIAELKFLFADDDAAELRAGMQGAPSRRWTDLEYALLLNDYERRSADHGKSAMYDMASVYGVSRTTIWRRLKEARRRAES